jgi:hypothetical protein
MAAKFTSGIRGEVFFSLRSRRGVVLEDRPVLGTASADSKFDTR